jgi:hypothetical protein
MDDLGIGVQSLVGTKDFTLTQNVQTVSAAHHPTVRLLPGALSPITKQMKLTLATHLHLVPRLGMRGAIPPHSDIPSWYGA